MESNKNKELVIGDGHGRRDYRPRKRVSNEYKQITTAPQQIFKSSLLSHLAENKINCDVFDGVSLFLYDKEDDLFIQQIHKYGEMTFRRPDIFIPKYLLVIEVDGPIHDNDDIKCMMDNRREYLFNSVGVQVTRISNDQAMDPIKRAQFIKEVIQYCKGLEQDPTLKCKRRRLRVKLHRARKSFFKKRYGSAKSTTNYHPKKYIRKVKVVRHYEGWRYLVRP